jgi:hypothetical protein
MQHRLLADSLIDNELRQVVWQVDLLSLKALAGELCTAAMGNTEQFEAVLEYPVKIARQHQLRLCLDHHQHRPVALAADLDMRVTGGDDAAPTT